MAVSPDGRRAFMLDATRLADQQRVEWRLNELELPSLRVLRRGVSLTLEEVKDILDGWLRFS
jgi:hypothetical protein